MMPANKAEKMRITKLWDGYRIIVPEDRGLVIFVGTIGEPCIITGRSDALTVSQTEALIEALKLAISLARGEVSPDEYAIEEVEANE
jgi:hypothetical protein